MAAKPKSVVPPEAVLMDRSAVLKEQIKAVTKLSNIKKGVSDDPIETAEEYALADQRRSAAKGLKKYFVDLLSPGIKLQKAAYDELVKSRNTVTNDADSIIDGETKRLVAFKVEEARLLHEAEEEANKKKDRLQAIADAKLQRANLLKSAPARARAFEQAAEAQVAAESVSVKVSGIEAEGSTTRTYKKCRVTDIDLFIEHVATTIGLDEDENLTSCLMLNMPELNAFFKLKDPAIGKWIPGVEVYEDINIFSKRQS